MAGEGTMVAKRRPLPAPAVPALGAPPDDRSLAWGGLWFASRVSRRHRRQQLPQRGHDGEGALGKGAGEEERESSASSSGVSPSSAMALAGSEAEKRGREWRGQGECSGSASPKRHAKAGVRTRGGHAAAAHYHGGARWRAAGAPRATRRCAPVHGRP